LFIQISDYCILLTTLLLSSCDNWTDHSLFSNTPKYCDCRIEGYVVLKRELNSHLCILLSFVVLVSGGKRGKGIYFLTVSVFLLLRDIPLRVLQELIDVLSKNLFEILHARLSALALLLSL